MNENQSAKNVDALRKLKQILLTDDQKRIEQIEEHLELLKSQFRDKEQLIETLNPIITELISNKIQSSRDEMAEALAPIMGEAIKKQIENAKDDVVDALYPVIGKTIRRSIAEAMKNLAETVNRKIEKALSLNLLFIKIKSKITGIPEEQMFLKEALPFLIHDIFYIHKKTGLLLSHTSQKKGTSSTDEDIISGMLTAIREFSKNAFSEDIDRDLKEIEYDDRQIILEGGVHAYLALVISGIYPDNFKHAVSDLESGLHKQYGSKLRNFDGYVNPFTGIKKRLENFIRKYNTIEKGKEDALLNRKFPAGLVSISTLIFLAIISLIIFYPEKPDGSKKSATKFGSTVIFDQNKLLNQLKYDLGNKLITDISKIKLIIQDSTLMLEGSVLSESDRVLVASAASRISHYPVIINNLKTITAAGSRKTAEDIIIYFDKQKSNLDLNAKIKLDVLHKQLSNLDYSRLIIFGHSDSLGTDEYNKLVSLDRANSVKAYLIKNGIEEQKIECRALADSLPIASNKTIQGQTLNRRVTFKLEE